MRGIELRQEASVDAETREFRPKKTAFIIPRITAALVLIGLVSLTLVIVALFAELYAVLVLIPLVALGVLLPAVYAANIAFTKERYEIHSDHLVCHRGGLLSDGRTELDIRNITHVRLRLPWLRHRFFKIGDVRIESAGSAASEITFQSIIGPEAVYEEVQELMRRHGFSLKRTQVLHQESPTALGALVDIVQTAFGAGFSLLIMAGVGLGALEEMDSLLSVGLIGLFALGSLVSAIGGLGVRYLDLTRRTYTVHDDAVDYTEGFLTRDNAFIPYENIADASVKRTPVDQVLGLYDVNVSCQGSGSEIAFRRLSRGEELRTAIVSLVANASQTARLAVEAPAAPGEGDPEASKEAASQASASPRSQRKLVDPDQAWTAELRMNLTRAIASTVLGLPFLPIWVVAVVGVFIRATRTIFTVGPNSISSAYTFIGSKQMDFAYDKVTGVQIDRNPLDDFFETVSVQIWSIGSSQPLTLPHISTDTMDLPALLRQCGIPSAAPVLGELEQSFGPKVWAIQNVFVLILLLVMTLGLGGAASAFGPLPLLLVPIIAVLPAIAAVTAKFRTDRQRITFHSEHLEAQTGIVFRQHIHVRYDNIKKVESTQIPLTDQGMFKVYVAGERQVQQQQNGAGVKLPYSLSGAYIHGISAKVDALDALMLGRIEASEICGTHPQNEDVVSVSKPSLANELVIMVLVGLLMPPIWLFVPIRAWQLKVRRYEVESDRVVMRGGIFFKGVTSVLFNRIDSLQQNQGALGKMFGNGQVTILTAGSSAPDLSIANIPDYQAVYATIRASYGKAV